MGELLFLLALGVGCGLASWGLLKWLNKKYDRWLKAVEKARDQMRQTCQTDSLFPLAIYCGGGRVDSYWLFGVVGQTAHLWQVWVDKIDKYSAPIVQAKASRTLFPYELTLGFKGQYANILVKRTHITKNSQPITSKNQKITKDEFEEIMRRLCALGLSS